MNRHEKLNDIEVLSNLEHIKLFNGEELIGEMHSSEAVKRFKEVKLSPGENHIKVEGYDKYGNIYIDEMILNGVNEIDKSYTLVKVEEKKHVVNWFEKFDLTNVQEVTLKEGYFSTFDTIKELYENEEAKEVFKKYFGDMAEHPKYKTVMMMTSIDAMSKLSRFNIPKELLTVINRELNVIAKIESN
jgi:beta-galactosidase